MLQVGCPSVSLASRLAAAERVKASVVELGHRCGGYTFNAAGANKALELMGRQFGLFRDQVEVTNSYVARIPPTAPDAATWLEQRRQA